MTSPGSDETPDERAVRNLGDLLQELRVATVGVQVLFGFLLALPFASRFEKLESWQRWLYIAIILLAAASTALLVAPVAYHRFLFRQRQRPYLISAANIVAICGLVTVGLAVTSAVLLVVSVVEPGVPAGIATAICVALFGGLWFVLPLLRREEIGDRPPGDQQERTGP